MMYIKTIKTLPPKVKGQLKKFKVTKFPNHLVITYKGDIDSSLGILKDTLGNLKIPHIYYSMVSIEAGKYFKHIYLNFRLYKGSVYAGDRVPVNALYNFPISNDWENQEQQYHRAEVYQLIG